jgi:chemotaxis protein histidine kinase CheA
MSSPADIDQALALFRAQFAEQLPARLAEISERLQAWRSDPSDGENLRALYRVLHRLAGSAGTFGMPEFGAACRGIEADLEELQSRGAALADVERIAQAISRLQEVRS